jgi:general secretion pathway protein L
MTGIQQRADALWRDARGAVDALIAELAAQRVMVRQPPTVLRIDDTGIDVLRRDSHGEELVLRVAGRPADAVQNVVDTIGAALGKDCALEIAPGLILTSRIVLPAESDDIIRAIVRNKVESIAPWPLPQSLYGQRIEAVPGDAAHVAVDVGVVSRALLEDIAARLAAAGTVVKAASLRLPSGESLRIDFGSEEESRAAQRRATRLAAILAAGAGAVAVVGFMLVWHASATLSATREETAKLTAELRPGAAGGALSLVQAANTLHERRRQRLPAVAVMSELSEVLPQTVWLDSLSLDDVRIDLKGQGSDIPSLIDILEQSPSFSDVNFASATQFNAESNTEAFSIGATLEPAAEEPAP